MSDSFTRLRRAAAVSCFALAAVASPTAAQRAGAPSPAQKAPAPAAEAAKPFSVKMSKAAPYTFTVKAKEAKLGDVAAEISRLIKVPVTLSPVMSKQKVTLDFGGLNLDATLRMLAPQPIVDYVAGGEPQPRPLAIYLQALNERPPSPDAAVRGNSEAILIEGDTEEGTDSEAQKKKEEEEPLKVTYLNNQLSVRARKQPLSVVLFRIASEVGVPFEMRYESPQVIDVEFNNYSLDEAVKSLSPEVRLYYRQDLQTFQIQPLRLALVSPTTAQS